MQIRNSQSKNKPVSWNDAMDELSEGMSTSASSFKPRESWDIVPVIRNWKFDSSSMKNFAMSGVEVVMVGTVGDPLIVSVNSRFEVASIDTEAFLSPKLPNGPS
jgi:hypothetical protein